MRCAFLVLLLGACMVSALPTSLLATCTTNQTATIESTSFAYFNFEVTATHGLTGLTYLIVETDKTPVLIEIYTVESDFTDDYVKTVTLTTTESRLALPVGLDTSYLYVRALNQHGSDDAAVKVALDCTTSTNLDHAISEFDVYGNVTTTAWPVLIKTPLTVLDTAKRIPLNFRATVEVETGFAGIITPFLIKDDMPAMEIDSARTVLIADSRTQTFNLFEILPITCLDSGDYLLWKIACNPSGVEECHDATSKFFKIKFTRDSDFEELSLTASTATSWTEYSTVAGRKMLAVDVSSWGDEEILRFEVSYVEHSASSVAVKPEFQLVSDQCGIVNSVSDMGSALSLDTVGIMISKADLSVYSISPNATTFYFNVDPGTGDETITFRARALRIPFQTTYETINRNTKSVFTFDPLYPVLNFKIVTGTLSDGELFKTHIYSQDIDDTNSDQLFSVFYDPSGIADPLSAHLRCPNQLKTLFNTVDSAVIRSSNLETDPAGIYVSIYASTARDNVRITIDTHFYSPQELTINGSLRLQGLGAGGNEKDITSSNGGYTQDLHYIMVDATNFNPAFSYQISGGDVTSWNGGIMNDRWYPHQPAVTAIGGSFYPACKVPREKLLVAVQANDDTVYLRENWVEIRTLKSGHEMDLDIAHDSTDPIYIQIDWPTSTSGHVVDIEITKSSASSASLTASVTDMCQTYISTLSLDSGSDGIRLLKDVAPLHLKYEEDAVRSDHNIFLKLTPTSSPGLLQYHIKYNIHSYVTHTIKSESIIDLNAATRAQFIFPAIKPKSTYEVAYSAIYSRIQSSHGTSPTSQLSGLYADVPFDTVADAQPGSTMIPPGHYDLISNIEFSAWFFDNKFSTSGGKVTSSTQITVGRQDFYAQDLSTESTFTFNSNAKYHYGFMDLSSLESLEGMLELHYESGGSVGVHLSNWWYSCLEDSMCGGHTYSNSQTIGVTGSISQGVVPLEYNNLHNVVFFEFESTDDRTFNLTVTAKYITSPNTTAITENADAISVAATNDRFNFTVSNPETKHGYVTIEMDHPYGSTTGHGPFSVSIMFTDSSSVLLHNSRYEIKSTEFKQTASFSLSNDYTLAFDVPQHILEAGTFYMVHMAPELHNVTYKVKLHTESPSAYSAIDGVKTLKSIYGEDHYVAIPKTISGISNHKCSQYQIDLICKNTSNCPTSNTVTVFASAQRMYNFSATELGSNTDFTSARSFLVPWTGLVARYVRFHNLPVGIEFEATMKLAAECTIHQHTSTAKQTYQTHYSNHTWIEVSIPESARGTDGWFEIYVSSDYSSSLYSGMIYPDMNTFQNYTALPHDNSKYTRYIRFNQYTTSRFTGKGQPYVSSFKRAHYAPSKVLIYVQRVHATTDLSISFDVEVFTFDKQSTTVSSPMTQSGNQSLSDIYRLPTISNGEILVMQRDSTLSDGSVILNKNDPLLVGPLISVSGYSLRYVTNAYSQGYVQLLSSSTDGVKYTFTKYEFANFSNSGITCGAEHTFTISPGKMGYYAVTVPKSCYGVWNISTNDTVYIASSYSEQSSNLPASYIATSGSDVVAYYGDYTDELSDTYSFGIFIHPSLSTLVEAEKGYEIKLTLNPGYKTLATGENTISDTKRKFWLVDTDFSSHKIDVRQFIYDPTKVTTFTLAGSCASKEKLSEFTESGMTVVTWAFSPSTTVSDCRIYIYVQFSDTVTVNMVKLPISTISSAEFSQTITFSNTSTRGYVYTFSDELDQKYRVYEATTAMFSMERVSTDTAHNSISYAVGKVSGSAVNLGGNSATAHTSAEILNFTPSSLKKLFLYMMPEKYNIAGVQSTFRFKIFDYDLTAVDTIADIPDICSVNTGYCHKYCSTLDSEDFTMFSRFVEDQSGSTITIKPRTPLDQKCKIQIRNVAGTELALGVKRSTWFDLTPKVVRPHHTFAPTADFEYRTVCGSSDTVMEDPCSCSFNPKIYKLPVPEVGNYVPNVGSISFHTEKIGHTYLPTLRSSWATAFYQDRSVLSTIVETTTRTGLDLDYSFNSETAVSTPISVPGTMDLQVMDDSTIFIPLKIPTNLDYRSKIEVILSHKGIRDGMDAANFYFDGSSMTMSLRYSGNYREPFTYSAISSCSVTFNEDCQLTIPAADLEKFEYAIRITTSCDLPLDAKLTVKVAKPSDYTLLNYNKFHKITMKRGDEPKRYKFEVDHDTFASDGFYFKAMKVYGSELKVHYTVSSNTEHVVASYQDTELTTKILEPDASIVGSLYIYLFIELETSDIRSGVKYPNTLFLGSPMAYRDSYIGEIRSLVYDLAVPVVDVNSLLNFAFDSEQLMQGFSSSAQRLVVKQSSVDSTLDSTHIYSFTVLSTSSATSPVVTFLNDENGNKIASQGYNFGQLGTFVLPGGFYVVYQGLMTSELISKWSSEHLVVQTSDDHCIKIILADLGVPSTLSDDSPVYPGSQLTPGAGFNAQMNYDDPSTLQTVIYEYNFDEDNFAWGGFQLKTTSSGVWKVFSDQFELVNTLSRSGMSPHSTASSFVSPILTTAFTKKLYIVGRISATTGYLQVGNITWATSEISTVGSHEVTLTWNPDVSTGFGGNIVAIPRSLFTSGNRYMYWSQSESDVSCTSFYYLGSNITVSSNSFAQGTPVFPLEGKHKRDLGIASTSSDTIHVLFYQTQNQNLTINFIIGEVTTLTAGDITLSKTNPVWVARYSSAREFRIQGAALNSELYTDVDGMSCGLINRQGSISDSTVFYYASVANSPLSQMANSYPYTFDFDNSKRFTSIVPTATNAGDSLVYYTFGGPVVESLSSYTITVTEITRKTVEGLCYDHGLRFKHTYGSDGEAVADVLITAAKRQAYTSRISASELDIEITGICQTVLKTDSNGYVSEPILKYADIVSAKPFAGSSATQNKYTQSFVFASTSSNVRYQSTVEDDGQISSISVLLILLIIVGVLVILGVLFIIHKYTSKGEKVSPKKKPKKGTQPKRRRKGVAP